MEVFPRHRSQGLALLEMMLVPAIIGDLLPLGALRNANREALAAPWRMPCPSPNPGSPNPTGQDVSSLGPGGERGTDDDFGNW